MAALATATTSRATTVSASMQDAFSVPSRPANVPEVSRGRRLPYSMSTTPAIGRLAHPVQFAPTARRSSGMAHPCPRGCISRRNSAILAYRANCDLAPGRRHPRAMDAAPAPDFHRLSGLTSLSGWLPTTLPQGSSHMAATIAPAPKRHQNNLLITLAAAARKADLAPRHYRIPHRATCRARRLRPLPAAVAVVTGRCASDRPPTEHHHGAHHRLVGAGHLHVGLAEVRLSAGRSGRSRRPSAAPASRCQVRPPAPPRCRRGSPARRIDGRANSPADTLDERLRAEHRARPLPVPQAFATSAPWCSAVPRGRPTAAPAGWLRAAIAAGTKPSPPAPSQPRRDADEPAPRVLRADDIDAVGSAAAADWPPSREPMAMNSGRAFRADGRRGWPEAGRRMASRREAPPPFPTDGDGTMNTAITVPGNTADTFLVHFFGGGLADERYVVERFKAHADGDIRPWPGGRSASRPRSGR